MLNGKSKIETSFKYRCLKKLKNLFGRNVYLSSAIENVKYFLSYKLNKSKLSLLNKGLNVSTIKSNNLFDGKVQAENLYKDFLRKASNHQLAVDNKDEL